MISSRWPRPIGIIESIAFRPVCIGSLTPWRWITPGALNSAGRVSDVLMSPLPSSGRPSGSTRRPSSSSPTGISSSLPVRLTVSPSTILSHSPNSTVPTLSSSRFSARPVTSWGSSSISSDMQLSRPWTRAMPSATERTVPTSARSALPVSRPSIRWRRIEEISSGLISICSVAPCSKSRVRSKAGGPGQAACATSLRSLSSRLRMLASSTRLPTWRTRPPMIDSSTSLVSSIVLPVLLLDLGADRLDHRGVELDRARHGHLEPLVLLVPELVEAPADPEQGRHPVLLGEQLEEVDQLRVAARDRLRDPLPLLRRGEVGAEEEDLQVVIGGDASANCAELLAGPRRARPSPWRRRTAPRCRPGRSPPSSSSTPPSPRPRPAR